MKWGSSAHKYFFEVDDVGMAKLIEEDRFLLHHLDLLGREALL